MRTQANIKVLDTNDGGKLTFWFPPNGARFEKAFDLAKAFKLKVRVGYQKVSVEGQGVTRYIEYVETSRP